MWLHSRWLVLGLLLQQVVHFSLPVPAQAGFCLKPRVAAWLAPENPYQADLNSKIRKLETDIRRLRSFVGTDQPAYQNPAMRDVLLLQDQLSRGEVVNILERWFPLFRDMEISLYAIVHRRELLEAWDKGKSVAELAPLVRQVGRDPAHFPVTGHGSAAARQQLEAEIESFAAFVGENFRRYAEVRKYLETPKNDPAFGAKSTLDVFKRNFALEAKPLEIRSLSSGPSIIVNVPKPDLDAPTSAKNSPFNIVLDYLTQWDLASHYGDQLPKMDRPSLAEVNRLARSIPEVQIGVLAQDRRNEVLRLARRVVFYLNLFEKFQRVALKIPGVNSDRLAVIFKFYYDYYAREVHFPEIYRFIQSHFEQAVPIAQLYHQLVEFESIHGPDLLVNFYRLHDAKAKTLWNQLKAQATSLGEGEAAFLKKMDEAEPRALKLGRVSPSRMVSPLQVTVYGALLAGGWVTYKLNQSPEQPQRLPEDLEELEKKILSVSEYVAQHPEDAEAQELLRSLRAVREERKKAREAKPTTQPVPAAQPKPVTQPA